MFGFLKEKLKSTISKISEKFSTDKDKDNRIEEVKEEKKVEEEIIEKKPTIKEEPKNEVVAKEKESKPIHEVKVEKKKEVNIFKEEIKREEKKEIQKIKPTKEPVAEKQKPTTETKKESPKVEEKKEISKPTVELKKVDELIIEKKISQEPIHKKETPKPSIEIKKVEEIVEEKKEEKKGFFDKIKEKITTTKISDSDFEEMFYELEICLLENNVAFEVIEKIKNDLKSNLVNKPIARSEVDLIVKKSLMNSINEVISIKEIKFFDLIKTKKPFVVCFFGINGSGKTTTIAKLAYLLKEKKYSVVLAAADTFRAASIEQLQHHAEKIGIKCIKHDYGSDPAAVAFDAVRHAESKNIDVVLIDTAGRMHSNTNLIDEMKKIVRVAKPDLKIFVGESITGNDCVEQAQTFDNAISIDGIILTKADVDEKGGAALSISYVTKKPILFLGMGQEYSDLKEFDPSIILSNLGLD